MMARLRDPKGPSLRHESQSGGLPRIEVSWQGRQFPLRHGRQGMVEARLTDATRRQESQVDSKRANKGLGVGGPPAADLFQNGNSYRGGGVLAGVSTECWEHLFQQAMAGSDDTGSLSISVLLRRTALVQPAATAVRLSNGEMAPALAPPCQPASLAIAQFELSEEYQPDRNQVVVFAFSLWQRWLGGDLALVGRTVQLNGRDFRVVGIMPKGFAFPEGGNCGFRNRGAVSDGRHGITGGATASIIVSHSQ